MRLALRANYSDTSDSLSAQDGARLAEVNAGFAYRPHDSSRWAALGKYTYLYELASSGQVGGASDDQRSHVLSLDGIWQMSQRWEMAGKLASRPGDYRMGRGEGAWLDSRADFFKLGVGNNFTNVSDDLTHPRLDNKGWCITMTGYYQVIAGD